MDSEVVLGRERKLPKQTVFIHASAARSCCDSPARWTVTRGKSFLPPVIPDHSNREQTDHGPS